MISSSIRSLNVLCIVGYLLFMGLAIDSTMVDALALYVSETDGRPVLQSGKVHVKPIVGKSGDRLGSFSSRIRVVASSGAALVARSYASSVDAPTGIPSVTMVNAAFPEKPANRLVVAGVPTASSPVASGSRPNPLSASFQASVAAVRANIVQGTVQPLAAPAGIQTDGVSPAAVAIESLSSSANSSSAALDDSAGAQALAAVGGPPVSGDGRLSILNLIKSAADRPWAYDPTLDRYVVRYDADTTLVLTLRPSLQRLVESVFHLFSVKMGAAILQDPSTGAVLAMTSFDGRTVLSPLGGNFVAANWALKPSFPVASLFKIITAAAAIERKGALPRTPVRIGKRATIELWKAFATSHNGVFGVVGRAVGRPLMQLYADAFGFNRPFYFDLPVSASVAQLPAEGGLLGQASAGLNKHFEISPIHVSSIISTILNRGRLMKPYLIDSVVYKGQVVFRRKAFQLSQPISQETAGRIYEMMRNTTTQGTGKRGFHGYGDCPDLAELCGGKTGTLTGISPNYLFTWFGGFTRTAGRDLGLTVLVGQAGTHNIKATTLAGRISYELLRGRTPTPTMVIRSASR
ncbi:MAG: penicillin-binding transpeptidase domain-containing protein [Candidatus Ozemobacteraceae bacterium]